MFTGRISCRTACVSSLCSLLSWWYSELVLHLYISLLPQFCLHTQTLQSQMSDWRYNHISLPFNKMTALSRQNRMRCTEHSQSGSLSLSFNLSRSTNASFPLTAQSSVWWQVAWVVVPDQHQPRQHNKKEAYVHDVKAVAVCVWSGFGLADKTSIYGKIMLK